MGASIIRWMCGFTLKERKKNAELQELLGLEILGLMAKKDRLSKVLWTF